MDDGSATNDRLLFMTNPNLTAAQLAQVSFFDDSNVLIASGAVEIPYDGFTELVPVPEPATWAGALGCVGLLAWMLLRRRGIGGRA